MSSQKFLRGKTLRIVRFHHSLHHHFHQGKSAEESGLTSQRKWKCPTLHAQMGGPSMTVGFRMVCMEGATAKLTGHVLLAGWRSPI